MMILEQRQLRHQVRQGVPRDRSSLVLVSAIPQATAWLESTFTAQRVREPVEIRVRSPYL